MSEETYDSGLRPPAAIEELRELWRYRELLRLLIVNAIKTRYRRSMLGVLWTLLNPLLTMTVLSIAFSSLFKSALERYPIYILSGLIFWNFFSQSITTSMGGMVWGSSLLKRIYVPRTIFTMSAIGSGLVNLGLGFAPLVLIMAGLGHPFTPALLFLPIAVCLLAAFTLGLALVLTTLAVFFVDVVDIFQVLLAAWFYLTPLMYPAEILPAGSGWILDFNPIYHLLILFRDPIYLGQWPAAGHVGAASLAAAAALAVGWGLFTWKADGFAYRL
jgi:ABC-2 type transport system permease protein